MVDLKFSNYSTSVLMWFSVSLFSILHVGIRILFLVVFSFVL